MEIVQHILKCALSHARGLSMHTHLPTVGPHAESTPLAMLIMKKYIYLELWKPGQG